MDGRGKSQNMVEELCQKAKTKKVRDKCRAKDDLGGRSSFSMTRW
jgi:hypothetical protein